MLVTAGIVNISVFNALSIGSGLIAAVLLCMKRDAFILFQNYLSRRDGESCIDLPEKVKGIVDGSHGYNNSFCSDCRQADASLRCSRCHIAKYCSVSIVKNHTLNITRITARQIAKSYARVEESMAGPAWEDGEEELVRGGDILHM